jgi:hypothetical protein
MAADQTSPSSYSILPTEGPDEVVIGSALITMVEPHVGHEREYNRWYEDDHFYAGAMAMPWMFAGRRWVAPRRLQQLRFPDPSPIASPLDAGKYIGTYWITAGRYEDHVRWTVATNQRLLSRGRIHLERDHVFTSFSAYHGAAYRDGASGPRDIHALDYPYQGLVVEVVDAASPDDRDALVDWLRDEHAPAVLAGSPVAMALLFTPIPLPADRMSYVEDVPGVDQRVTVLWLCEADPADIWDQCFAPEAQRVDAGGHGTVVFTAPFIPTLPGTDTHVDELR